MVAGSHTLLAGPREALAGWLATSGDPRRLGVDVVGFVTDEGGGTSHVAILARSLGVPLIALDASQELKGIPKISTNDERIGQMAADHLMERGFSHYAFCGYDHLHWSQGRCESFRKAVEAAGGTAIDFLEEFLLVSDPREACRSGDLAARGGYDPESGRC